MNHDHDRELKELRYADGTRERLVAAAELAARAEAAGDVEAAAQAKAIETRIARELGQHQHAVVACAELIDRWPALAALGELSDDTTRMVIWGLKYGAGSAMDLPEIPLATVEEVIAHLERVLGHAGRKPWAAWELDARRAFIAGDGERLRERVAAIGPTIGRTSHAWQDSDCPGCTLLAFADYLGAEARPEEVEAVLAPVLLPSGARFPADSPETTQIFDLLYGDDPICENARATTPVKLARAYARHGRVAEARREAERALGLARGREPERVLRALVAALEVATARRAPDDIAPLAESALPIAAGLEDAYERLDADLVLHAAIGLLPTETHAALRAAIPRLADDARALARRIDARLPRPRHVTATERALALANTPS
jgi:hypothetical protein